MWFDFIIRLFVALVQWIIDLTSGNTIWKRISFTMHHQENTYWCWAATSFSVNRFFNQNSTWTQCSIVNAELERTDCCTNGSSSNCNIPWRLEKALQRTGNFSLKLRGAGNIVIIRAEIDFNRPLCVRIGWKGGGGHFIAVDGYNQGLNMVAVDDPWYGASDIDLGVLQTAYQGSGSWTNSYVVEP